MAEACTVNHIDHVAIAVKDIEQTLEFFQSVFAVPPSDVSVMPEHGVKATLIQVGQTRIELLEALDPTNSVGRFVESRGEGLHHLALNVTGLQEKLNLLEQRGIRLIDKQPREGLSGQVAFIHPRSVFGVLTELVEN